MIGGAAEMRSTLKSVDDGQLSTFEHMKTPGNAYLSLICMGIFVCVCASEDVFLRFCFRKDLYTVGSEKSFSYIIVLLYFICTSCRCDGEVIYFKASRL